MLSIFYHCSAQENLHFKLDNNLEFEFETVGKRVIGLKKVTIDGTSLKSEKYISLPLIADEWFNKEIFPILELEKTESKTKQGGFALHLRLKGTKSKKVWKHFFPFGQSNNNYDSLPGYDEIVAAERKLMEWAADQDIALSYSLKKLDSLKDISPNSSFRSKEKKEKQYNSILKALKLKSETLAEEKKNSNNNAKEALLRIEKAKLNSKQLLFENSEILRDMHSFAITEVPFFCTENESLKSILTNKEIGRASCRERV